MLNLCSLSPDLLHFVAIPLELCAGGIPTRERQKPKIRCEEPMCKKVKQVESPNSLEQLSCQTLPWKSRRRRWMKISTWRQGGMVRGGQAASSALHRLNASGVQICEERLSTCLVQVPGLLIMDTPGHAACQKLVTANC